MKKLPLSALIVSVFALAACQQPANSNSPTAASGAASASDAAAPAGLETLSKQISYVMGQDMANTFTELKNNGIEVDMKIFTDSVQSKLDGKPAKMTESQIAQTMQTFKETLIANQEKKAKENQEAGDKFLTENKNKEGVKTTASGLQYKVNKEGTGDVAALGDGVMVEYTGKLIDGTEFDSTKAHGGEPFAVPLVGDNVIQGWTEGLQLMKEGGEYTLYVPAKLGYGSNPQPKIPANSVLVFDMKIVKIAKGAVKDQLNKSNAKSATKK